MKFDYRILVVVSCLTVVSGWLAGLQENNIAWPDDPEIKWKDDTKYPDSPDRYKDTTDGAEPLGNTLAGRTEFPYMVDIRLEGRDQEDWAIGNLLSHKSVLTTCRWSKFCLRITREIQIDWGAPELKDIRYRNNVPELSVLYAPLYFEKELTDIVYNFWEPKTTKTKQGRRSVRFISTHPKCEEDANNYDFSVLVLSREIPPVLPYVGFMPIRIERSQLLITDFDLSRHEGQHIVCYVASIGRNYRNWENHITVDYKVKYRAYYEDWASCTFHLPKYRCISSEQDLPLKPGANRTYHHCPGELVSQSTSTDKFSKGYENLMCFSTRYVLGGVCDHDNGAPLVCDGKVFGIVMRGAHYAYCNNVLPLPFVVAKITPASDYYFNLARNPYSFSLLLNPGDIEGLSYATMVRPFAKSFRFSVTVLLSCVFSRM